jgi:hypothetical protein
MMMRMLEAGGVAVLTDGIRKPDPDNPLGYYEFEPAKRLDDLRWVAAARGMAVKLLYCPVIYRLPAEFSYQVIFMRRVLDEIVASQRAMLDRMGIADPVKDPARIVALYRSELEKVEAWFTRQRNFAIKFIDYDQTLGDAKAISLEIRRFLDREMNETRMAAIVDTSLYHQRVPIISAPAKLATVPSAAMERK